MTTRFGNAVDEKTPYFTAQGLVLFRPKGQGIAPGLLLVPKDSKLHNLSIFSSSGEIIRRHALVHT